MNIDQKYELLKNKLKEMGKVLVAYSGGVDSNFLLKVASDVLGENAVAVTVHAMMHSSREIEEAKEYTKEFGVKHKVIKVDNFDEKGFIENGVKRCYYCKCAVFNMIKDYAQKNGIKYILDGTNLSDLGDYRPGLKALEELNVVSPLKDSELTKDEIRILSKRLGLKTHNKPSFACLASRIPYGDKITEEKLRLVEEAENYLQDLGFRQYRVRIHSDIARIEVAKDEINKFFDDEMMKNVYTKLKDIGFKYVTLDLNGYEMGSLNK